MTEVHPPPPHGWAGSGLAKAAKHHLETFLAQAADADPLSYGLPT